MIDGYFYMLHLREARSLRVARMSQKSDIGFPPIREPFDWASLCVHVQRWDQCLLHQQQEICSRAPFQTRTAAARNTCITL